MVRIVGKRSTKAEYFRELHNYKAAMGGCENRYIFVPQLDVEFGNHPGTGKLLGDHEFGPIFEMKYDGPEFLVFIPVLLGNFEDGAYIDYLSPDSTPVLDLLLASLFNGEIYIEDFVVYLADMYGELLDCEKISRLLFIDKYRKLQDVKDYIIDLDELKINKLLDEIKETYDFTEH